MVNLVFSPTGDDWFFTAEVFAIFGTTGVIAGERRVPLDAAAVFHR